ncbi:S1 RNA-binding domain-containing protein [Natronomonas salina]|uniref:OB-fold nucleic acid binding domain-containing protein n=1 Tax=Natronomonas salina TaxID=1710540 RepID=UPI0015B5EA27|nr:OB-fold nucleic acid binding domain-containing protein [Natronomonas salina]QLD87791.1 S1 RNA-binding domain-containing protein [Natronomonas salina]
MGNCIICGTSTDGPICDVHQEDVLFEFEGDKPSQLTPGRFYRGTVDGYAEFGVFVDIGNVTGLLHRSKLDRRLESLDWEVGDTVSVQVNNIRDNGDIDLGWSIRQTPDEFRGLLVDAPDGDYLADEYGDDDSGSSSESSSSSESQSRPESAAASRAQSDADTSADATDEEDDSEFEFDDEQSAETASESTSTDEDAQRGADEQTGGTPSDADLAETTTDSDEAEGTAADFDRVAVEELRDRVGDTVRLEGEVVSVRQTSGPTVFELRDETGVVDCAAFVEAGVRAYPEIEADDVVRLDGEIRLRRDEIQVETESLVALEGDERDAVVTRMDEALDDRASPDEFELLADDDALENVSDDVTDAATVIRRAVLESRPVVVRHDATTDGYVAGAAIERAVLPLVEEEHATADAVYHYFDRRPLEDGVYDMNDATKDATRMLGDRERHDEKLPLFVFAAAGSTAASTDGLELLDIYGAPRVVLDGRRADDEVVDEIDSLVTAEERSAATVAANVAAAVNEDVRDDVRHLPAVSYWDDAPSAYADLAEDAGVDAETAKQLREAIALEAFYQSYEDKRELIIDLLFEKRTGLAEQVSEQFRTKLQAELDTATANLEEREVDGATVTVLDTDAYTHRYDFPPTRLLLDELHRRLDADAIVGVATDELHVRSRADLDVDAVVAALESAAPNAGVSDPGARQPKLEFLRGERDAVLDAVVDAVAEQVVAPSA